MLLAVRVANALGKPFGINPFPRAFANTAVTTTDRGRAFDEIYSGDGWQSAESASGPGSERARTDAYRAELETLLDTMDIGTLLDAPCGDLNWIMPVARRLNYIGGDIAPALVGALRERHPGLDLRVIDICRDSLPAADIWHCRDCMMHLPLADIWLALENFARSEIPHALFTTHRSRWGHRNLDIPVGGWRYLDLEKPPFSLPRPRTYLRDYRRGFDFPRYVGLWDRQVIVDRLEHHRATA